MAPSLRGRRRGRPDGSFLTSAPLPAPNRRVCGGSDRDAASRSPQRPRHRPPAGSACLHRRRRAASSPAWPTVGAVASSTGDRTSVAAPASSRFMVSAATAARQQGRAAHRARQAGYPGYTAGLRSRQPFRADVRWPAGGVSNAQSSPTARLITSALPPSSIGPMAEKYFSISSNSPMAMTNYRLSAATSTARVCFATLSSTPLMYL